MSVTYQTFNLFSWLKQVFLREKSAKVFFFMQKSRLNGKNTVLEVIQPKLTHFTCIKNKKELQNPVLLFTVQKTHFFEE